MSFWDDTIWLSGSFDDGFVHEQDRDAVPNRVSTTADAALQGQSFVLQNERFFARGTDQDVEQILRDHENGFYAESYQPSAFSYQATTSRPLLRADS